ncbi:hypothetical protein DERP_004968 [Dermatophagoides pteronyssinus]|uniref:Uncharacterized protein n=1 Tax=Dermatophagoides pteronyssinus TaxID=6956 RepID=A0ABQ8JT02_DERPT|nr:hypothetical protein DERP_004968 [Dermatophagoides pteronyssinus]
MNLSDRNILTSNNDNGVIKIIIIIIDSSIFVVVVDIMMLSQYEIKAKPSSNLALGILKHTHDNFEMNGLTGGSIQRKRKRLANRLIN